MATTTFSSASMRYYDSSWHDGQARQGMYSTTNYRGEITFNFSSSVDVSNIDITEIVLTVTAGALGGDYTKYLYLHTGSYNGSSVEDFQFTSFFDTTKSKTLNASSYSTAFSRLKSYIEGGGTTLGIYTATSRGKGSGKQYDYDYCSITAMSLKLTYTYKKSTGSISSAKTGSTATLTINAHNNAYKHKVTWALGSNSKTQTIAAGTTTASTEIPDSWLPNAESGTATVTLETLNGSASLGSNTYSFKVTVPASVTPSIGSLTISYVNSGASSTAAGWGLYIQGKCKAKATLSGVTAGNGASIKSYSIITSPNVGSGTASTMTTKVLSSSGTVTFTAKVTDSRGRTATKTASITVQAYAPPKLSSTPSIYRCNSAGTKQETTGTYAKLTASFTFSSVSSKNSLTTKRVTLNSTNTTLTSGTAVVIGGGNLALDTAYTATITLTDAVGSTVTASVAIPSAAYLIHFKKGGKSMGLGRAAGTSNDKTIHVGWDVDVDSGHAVKIIGTGQASAFIIKDDDSNPTKACAMVVSGSSVRRGLYDLTNGEWMIFTSGDNVTRIDRPLWVNGTANARSVSVHSAGSSNNPVLNMRDYDGIQMGYALVSTSNRRWYFYENPTDFDSNGGYRELFYLPTPATGLTASKSYAILTSKTPVTIAQGGTGATGAGDARANLGIKTGMIQTNSYSIPANGYIDIPVTFPTAYAGSTPRIIVGFTTDSTAGAFGSCSCGVLKNSSSKTGFTIRAFNAGSSARTPGYQWIAIPTT